ncbi:MAG: GNAT family N-acetyltransferase [Acidimicrobiia bacterium]|nr:GNAT family N-acetyltransferase [Acidimicrobiia bacterium]
MPLDPSRCDELTDLLDAALPGEALGADELLAVLWDDPGVVLGDDRGVTAAVVRESTAGRRTGHVRLLAVHPGARRQGRGRALLAAAEEWLRERDVSEAVIGGEAPFYLWPGVDVRATGALSLLEVAGYVPRGAVCNLSCPSTFRRAAPEGTEIRRVLDDADVTRLLTRVGEEWPWWVPEVERGSETGGVFAALEGEAVVGFACHSVNRVGWVGPMGTQPDRGGRGIGSALLGAVCRDLMVAGRPDAEIAWVGPIAFYARVTGAAVSRVFRVYRKDLVA